MTHDLGNVSPMSARETAVGSKCDHCAVRSFAICATLHDHELEALNALSTTAIVQPGDTIFFEGDEARTVFNVTRGILRTTKMLADGRRQITGFLFPGDFAGLNVDDLYAYTAEPVTAACLCRFDRKALNNFMDSHREMEKRMLTMAQTELARAQDRMLLLGRKTAQEKVASFLLMMSMRQGSTDRFDLPITRQDIADYLGLTLETVSRTFSKLVKSNVIEQVANHVIVVRDRDALEDCAEAT